MWVKKECNVTKEYLVRIYNRSFKIITSLLFCDEEFI